MLSHTFLHVDRQTYLQRLATAFAGPVLFFVFIMAFAYLGTDSVWTLFAGVVLLGLYLAQRTQWGRIYVTEIIEMPDDKVKIVYMDKNETKEYVTDKKTMHIQRNTEGSKAKVDKEHFVLFKDEKKGFTLKQYAFGDWEDEVIDQVVENWELEQAIAY